METLGFLSKICQGQRADEATNPRSTSGQATTPASGRASGTRRLATLDLLDLLSLLTLSLLLQRLRAGPAAHHSPWYLTIIRYLSTALEPSRAAADAETAPLILGGCSGLN